MIRATGQEVPAALEWCWQYLLQREEDGVTSEGIFRLAPERTELDEAKEMLRIGVEREALAGLSGACYASLIKQYLANIPDDVWEAVRPQINEAVLGNAETGDIENYLPQLGPREAGLVAWTFDVMARVVSHQVRVEPMPRRRPRRPVTTGSRARNAPLPAPWGGERS